MVLASPAGICLKGKHEDNILIRQQHNLLLIHNTGWNREEGGVGSICFHGDECRSELNLYLEWSCRSVLGGLVAYNRGLFAGYWKSLDRC